MNPSHAALAPASREVRIPCAEAWLYGDLVVPAGTQGVVLFAHGSGSGRHSARNRQVAQTLQHAGIGTLLFTHGWMGGGDVKLLAACALWFDLDQGWKMLVAVAIAGGLESLIIMMLRLLPWSESVRRRIAWLRKDEALPYGVAIAAGMVGMGLAVR